VYILISLGVFFGGHGHGMAWEFGQNIFCIAFLAKTQKKVRQQGTRHTHKPHPRDDTEFIQPTTTTTDGHFHLLDRIIPDRTVTQSSQIKSNQIQPNFYIPTILLRAVVMCGTSRDSYNTNKMKLQYTVEL